MIKRLDLEVFIETDADDATLVNDMDGGAVSALGGFPSGNVIQVDVDNVHALTQEEIEEKGFEE